MLSLYSPLDDINRLKLLTFSSSLKSSFVIKYSSGIAQSIITYDWSEFTFSHWGRFAVKVRTGHDYHKRQTIVQTDLTFPFTPFSFYLRRFTKSLILSPAIAIVIIIVNHFTIAIRSLLFRCR